MTTRCKFHCDSVTEFKEGAKAMFYAVHNGSPENEKFFLYTPSASMELQLVKKNVFVPGKQYYIDITEATK